MEKICTIDSFIDSRIESLELCGRNVTARNYGKARRCLHRYCPNPDLSFADITEDFINGFNAYLEQSGIQKATISFYNRILRSLYNQAVKEGLIRNTHPFDSVYTGVPTKYGPVHTTRRKAISFDDISKDELEKRYRALQSRYNTLVGKLSAIVGA